MLTSIRKLEIKNARLIFHTKKSISTLHLLWKDTMQLALTNVSLLVLVCCVWVEMDVWEPRRGSSTLVRSLHGVITQKAVQLIPSIGDSKCLLFTTSFISEHQKIH